MGSVLWAGRTQAFKFGVFGTSFIE